MSSRVCGSFACLLLSLCSCRPTSRPAAPADEPPGLFRDVAAEAGLAFAYRNGEDAGRYAILQTLGGGVGVIDYDRDGRPDLFFTGGGRFEGRQAVGVAPRLYRNLGGGRFQDVTAEVGLDRLAGGAPWFYSHGVAVADDDRDGWPDLLVTGYGRVALFRNEGGKRFRDATQQAGLAVPFPWATSAAWGDLDGDGWPDLYVCQYLDWSNDNDPECIGFDARRRDICPPSKFTALPHRLYRNARGVYADVGDAAGLRVPRPEAALQGLTHLDAAARDRLAKAARERAFGKGLGVVFVDVDGDGRPDVYVANDTDDNFLYLNRTRPGGPILLEEVGLASGVARDDQGAPNGSMGVAVADLGGGLPSLVVTNYEAEVHALYLNESRPPAVHFEHASTARGLAALGHSYVGWGVAFLDFDRDGAEDLVIVNGHPNFFPQLRGPREQVAVALRGGRRFADLGARAGPYFTRRRNGRGLAVVDFDGDGRPDVAVSHVNAPAALLRNEDDSGHHWLGVDLVGAGGRDVTGARVVLEAGGRAQTRFHVAGASYLSCNDRRHLFGLGKAARVDRVTVHWPSGRAERFDGPAVDRYWRLEEGK